MYMRKKNGCYKKEKKLASNDFDTPINCLLNQQFDFISNPAWLQGRQKKITMRGQS